MIMLFGDLPDKILSGLDLLKASFSNRTRFDFTLTIKERNGMKKTRHIMLGIIIGIGLMMLGGQRSGPAPGMYQITTNISGNRMYITTLHTSDGRIRGKTYYDIQDYKRVGN